MSSTYLGLSIASSGLNAAQIGLATTTNNISNIDTTGYSRQLVNQTSVGPAAVYSSSLVGNGVNVTSVDRAHSDSLDQKYWQENSAASGWSAKSTYLSQLETVFGSTTDDTTTSTISTALDTFNTDLESLSSDPTSTSARATVLAQANTLCSTLNDTASELTQLRSDINNEVQTTVNQINSYTTQIADLNKQINVATASGGSANELEDQADVVIDKLSGLVGITVTKSTTGTLNITMGNSTLVDGSESKQLECSTVTDTTSAEYGMYGISDATSGEVVTTGDSGALNSYLELRDGASSASKGIPYYTSQLNEFAQTLAKSFNEGITVGTTTYSGNAAGYGLDNTTGVRFFSYDNKSSADFISNTTTSATAIDAAYANITAANITVSKDIQEDSNKIAASSTADSTSNNTNLADMISISQSADIFGNTTATGFYGSMIATVGTASASATTQYNRKNALTSYINTSRSSVSGVSSNEETVNLTKYQAAYAASGSLTSTWSKIYDDTINMVISS
jgi:flagellar hook-associated protein 1 FlgK